MKRVSINHIGVVSFQNEYTHTNVLFYLLSCMLKSKTIIAKDMSEKTGFHLKKCQRYIYNSLSRPASSVNLEDIFIILNYINYSYSDLFKDIDNFINNKYNIAIFYKDSFDMYYNTYNSKFTIQDIKSLLKLRKKLLTIYKLPEYKDQVEYELSLYPSSLIIQAKNMSTINC